MATGGQSKSANAQSSSPGSQGSASNVANSASIPVQLFQSLLTAEVGKAKAELKMELKADLDAALAPIKNEVGKIEGLPNTRTMIFTVFGAATSLFLGGLAVLAYGGDRFGDGASSVGALAQQKVEERQRQEQIIQQQHDSEARLRCLIEKQQAPKLVCDDKP